MKSGETKKMKSSKVEDSYKFAHNGDILCVALSSDGLYLASGGNDKTVKLWNAKNFEFIDQFLGHTDIITGLAFQQSYSHPIGQLKTTGIDGNVVPDVNGDNNNNNEEDKSEEYFSTTGSSSLTAPYQLYSCSKDKTVKVWDVKEMTYIETLFGHEKACHGLDTPTYISNSSSSTTNNNNIKNITRVLVDGEDTTPTAIETEEIVISCGDDCTLRYWNIVKESQLVYKGDLKRPISCLKFICPLGASTSNNNNNSSYFISGDLGGNICLWSKTKQKPIHIIRKAHGNCWIISIGVWRNYPVFASGASDGKIKFWKVEKVGTSVIMKLLKEINFDGFVNAIEFSRDGRKVFVAVGTEHKLGRWSSNKKVKNSIAIIDFSSLSVFEG